MSSLVEILSFDNPAFNAYAFYGAALSIKMLVMSPLTGRQRYRKQIFPNPEDAKLHNVPVKMNDEDVDRVKRAHLNDLENIPVFMVVSGLYLLTSPVTSTAVNLMRAFTLARYAHTLVYAVVVVPQPARGIAWGVGFGITVYMSVKTLMHFASYL